jgi:hypothetical protein
MSQGTTGREYRNKLVDFMKAYGGTKSNFSANPMEPKTIEIPSYMRAMRKINVTPIDIEAGKKK